MRSDWLGSRMRRMYVPCPFVPTSVGFNCFHPVQQAMIRKYRERWEKLKESAKRKKEAKAAAVAAASPVRERIIEEPEAEEELDNTY